MYLFTSINMYYVLKVLGEYLSVRPSVQHDMSALQIVFIDHQLIRETERSIGNRLTSNSC